MVAKDVIENPQPDFSPAFDRQIAISRKRLLSVTETAEIFGPSPWFWRERIWAREIRFIKINRKYLLDRRDIEKFLERQKEINAA